MRPPMLVLLGHLFRSLASPRHIKNACPLCWPGRCLATEEEFDGETREAVRRRGRMERSVLHCSHRQGASLTGRFSGQEDADTAIFLSHKSSCQNNCE
ncbi:hypothetical protein RB7747 [Rhodopirellula baltica SH 1]|uniref:Uncharacterized protein n=1 Tax=Rhodopirellula baltica (strain DSM 10527 / NCIMB 13988 / SH1) TaxID=243090 RepID=Q7UN69_RHOBA|nr:hypothetical protein RB7747 [Rhodopirellula baltica SH 1]